ncbi:608_t:CDS:2 [Ambispora leptoticha]|uniref:608_t:CDS:1 n=1 Tax=Ambispora leptoticha TaxID=144679 RepID=A0A9N9CII8_9GLOM|nr:608_t:CDS:2 [Ambispora leptoticha]
MKKELGISKSIELSPHTLRRAFATYHAEAGLPLPLLQKLLGHSSIRTTALYWRNIYRDDGDNDTADILTSKKEPPPSTENFPEQLPANLEPVIMPIKPAIPVQKPTIKPNSPPLISVQPKPVKIDYQPKPKISQSLPLPPTDKEAILLVKIKQLEEQLKKTQTERDNLTTKLAQTEKQKSKLELTATQEKQRANYYEQQLKTISQLLHQWQKLNYYQQLEKQRAEMEAQIIQPPPWKCDNYSLSSSSIVSAEQRVSAATALKLASQVGLEGELEYRIEQAIKNKIQEFKDGYLFSCEVDGKRKREVYTIQSPKLKAILRGIAFSGETDDSFSRKAEIGSRSGNYSSYEEDVDNTSDRFIITRICGDGSREKELNGKEETLRPNDEEGKRRNDDNKQKKQAFLLTSLMKKDSQGKITEITDEKKNFSNSKEEKKGYSSECQKPGQDKKSGGDIIEIDLDRLKYWDNMDDINDVSIVKKATTTSALVAVSSSLEVQEALRKAQLSGEKFEYRIEKTDP